ncbi:DUF58 domain-containing protein [Persicirhabdus sediminis]|uniref:DUF58 domain-containing protein n=1 Tax=Persicirhabdus sediminis TaxID=454144 RepID=A0A8J7MAN3_9BACT|nr:DUF58 domain-containing protein [Persicirhabdus sediminis]MBK1789548.1 DUF58 domain-containing protein [Persicirhabdus sediminis]
MQVTRYSLYLATLWTLLGLAASVMSSLQVLWLALAALLLAFLLFDLLLLYLQAKPEFERDLPTRFAIDIEQTVVVKMTNRSRFSLACDFYDGLPAQAHTDELPWSFRVAPASFEQLSYPVKISERGRMSFQPVHLRLYSPLRLWRRKCRAGEVQETKVYPNYEPVMRYALLAMDNKISQMGIKKRNLAGMSREFHQLRDYQLGDSLAQIDWKASSKRLNLISRDYQEQRDQTVIIAIDCGRRLRSLDGGIPQFDHVLNAALLLAYIALRQGDHVGVISFGSDERFLPPVKGVQAMTTVLNHLYDYKTSNAPSDFSHAARTLLARQKRRSMVVMLSNIRGEDGISLVEPMRMLRQRHVTLLASLREQSIADRLETAVESFEESLEYAATQRYLEERNEVMAELHEHGVFCIDSTAKELPIALANRYLTMREML